MNRPDAQNARKTIEPELDWLATAVIGTLCAVFLAFLASWRFDS